MNRIMLFACIEKNLGDDLFIYVLCKRYNNIQFIIDNKANYGDLQKIDNLEFSSFLRYLNKFINYHMIKSPIKRIIGKIIFRLISTLLGHNNFLVYIVGNAFKNYNYIGKKQIYWLRNLVNLSSRFYLLSTNYGPCNDNRWISDCSDVFEKITDICFRDRESYELFSNLNNVRFAPDAVLTLKTDVNKKFKDKKKVIISIINCRERYSDKVLDKADEYENKIIELSNRFIDDGFYVVLLCSNTIQDFPAVERIVRKCKYNQKIDIFKYEGNFKDVFELYRESNYVVSTRLHSMILAWIFKTPVFPISYDIKVSNLINSYSFNNPYCELSEIDNLNYDEIIHAFENYDFSFFKNLQSEAEKQFSKLDMVLK